MLLYLSDVDEGGETVFPELDAWQPSQDSPMEFDAHFAELDSCWSPQTSTCTSFVQPTYRDPSLDLVAPSKEQRRFHGVEKHIALDIVSEVMMIMIMMMMPVADVCCGLIDDAQEWWLILID